jgi:redox-sensitive bicupin YhaK (pirin superfamily)
MSNLDPHPTAAVCGGTADVATGPVVELLEGRDVVLGGTRGMPVSRTLPNKERRMVGAWCFVDQYQGDVAMRVPPHPHTGLQTVTWLVEGEVRHRDSLASDQLIHPGQLNLMTAGRGIAHAEESPAGWTGALHGVQLWVALPDADRDTAPAFAHHADLPGGRDGGATVRVLMGELGGARSAAVAYSPIIGAEASFDGPGRVSLPLEPDFEHAVLVVSGRATVDGTTLDAGPLLYLGTGRRALTVAAEGPARLLLLGGEPFAEEIVMWWNFIGRSHDDIAAYRDDWSAGRRFGEVAFDGAPLPAPELPTITLKPRGRVRRP